MNICQIDTFLSGDRKKLRDVLDEQFPKSIILLIGLYAWKELFPINFRWFTDQDSIHAKKHQGHVYNNDIVIDVVNLKQTSKYICIVGSNCPAISFQNDLSILFPSNNILTVEAFDTKKELKIRQNIFSCGGCEYSTHRVVVKQDANGQLQSTCKTFDASSLIKLYDCKWNQILTYI